MWTACVMFCKDDTGRKSRAKSFSLFSNRWAGWVNHSNAPHTRVFSASLLVMPAHWDRLRYNPPRLARFDTNSCLRTLSNPSPLPKIAWMPTHTHTAESPSMPVRPHIRTFANCCAPTVCQIFVQTLCQLLCTNCLPIFCTNSLPIFVHQLFANFFAQMFDKFLHKLFVYKYFSCLSPALSRPYIKL